MKIIVKGQSGLVVTKWMRAYAENSLSSLENVFDGDVKLEVKCTVEKHLHIVEISLKTKNHNLRVKSATESYYDALDYAISKLRKNIRKYNKKIIDIKRNSKAKKIADIPWWEKEDENLDLDLENNFKNIVKEKAIDIQTISKDDAIMQMKLLEHDFYMFNDIETDKISVLYQRNDGDYGVISQI